MPELEVFEKITDMFPPAEASEAEYEEYIGRNILFENANFIAINKPKGLPCQGGSGISNSIDELVRGKGFKLTHRLDKDTSGVLLLAKTSNAATAATKSFKEKECT